MALVGYLLAFTFFADSRHIYGWHQAPFYPLLCLGTAWFLRRAWRARSAAVSIAVFGLLLTWIWQEFWLVLPGFPRVDRAGYFLSLAVLLGLTQLPEVLRRRNLLRVFAGVLLIFGLGCEVERARTFSRENWVEIRKTRRVGSEKTPPGFM
jgi:hypothetical protein